jgi:hypothetical protein
MAFMSSTGAIEWLGGVMPLPFVEEDGRPFRPEALFWVSTDGLVLGSTTARPGELRDAVASSLRTAMHEPLAGSPHRPDRIRVASTEIADALRAADAAIEVVCAPTPELEPLFDALRARLDEDAPPPSYLSDECDAARVAAFFRATAALHRFAPWNVVPPDALFSITIEELGVRDLVTCVIGHMGERFGLVFFSSLEDHARFGDHPIEGDCPPHLALTFDADVPRELSAEIEQHGWELAAPHAVPWLVAVDGDLECRPATSQELTMAEAVARALPAAIETWDETGSVDDPKDVRVSAHAGDVVVRVAQVYAPVREPAEVLADLRALDEAGDLEPELRRELENELMHAFCAAPESESVEPAWCAHVMDWAGEYLGRTIATIDAERLRDVLFSIAPRKVTVDPSAAAEIIPSLRAFYRFLKRTCDLPQADACARVLGGRAASELESALGDPANFGMAKSFFMSGRAAGFDMNSQAGIDAWAAHLDATTARARPTSQAPSSRTVRAKKKQRKAERSAKKRNRRR